MAPVICDANMTIVFPNIDGTGEKGYGYQLMKLVLKKTGKPYKLIFRHDPVNQERAFNYLKKGLFSVVDGCAGRALEEKAWAVYIPIDRGLLGWRVFIIHQDQEKEFSQISHLDQLQVKVAGQGIKWVDIKILEQSGIKVIASPKIDNLFRMVHAGRFDFIPLGVSEVYGFLEQYGKDLPKLMVEKSLTLVYPLGRFFYVKKGNAALHEDIARGLEAAWADGSFQQFIFHHPFTQQGLNRCRLSQRAIVSIDNPFTTQAFNLIDPKWWYDPTNH
ncbi:MAG: transporter substrate-binding domain-containing protein [Desulfobacter sp.]|nr:transporter substrate-binding domain-containing protein [Desulfobacter sp.]WDP84301.1 MAG: transporter substrate-binding domain-containing protein [Desulfobacter sp.]